MKLAAIALASIAMLQCANAFDVVKMLCLVNKARKENGRVPLGLSQQLTNAAAQHSAAQAKANSMSHQLSGEPSPSQRITNVGFDWTSVAENVAYGYADEETCMSAWMTSPGHRENILGPYNQFGAAVAYSGSTPYYTQDFGNDGKGGSYPECPSGTHDTSSPDVSTNNTVSTGTSSPVGSSDHSRPSYSTAPAPSPAPATSIMPDSDSDNESDIRIYTATPTTAPETDIYNNSDDKSNDGGRRRNRGQGKRGDRKTYHRYSYSTTIPINIEAY